MTVRLVPLAEAAEVRRRWPVWKPWAVAGAGVVVAAIGIPFQLKAADTFEAFRTTFDQECGATRCVPMDSTLAIEDRATLQNRIAIGLFTVGAVVGTTGFVLVYLNRERAVIAEKPAAVSLVPMVTPRSGGLAIAASF